MAVVENLRKFRMSMGISQQTLADALETTQQAIYKYEKKGTEPDIRTLKQLADYFNTTIDELVGHTSPMGDGNHLEELTLNQDEIVLVQSWRKLSDEERISIRMVIKNYLQEN